MPRPIPNGGLGFQQPNVTQPVETETGIKRGRRGTLRPPPVIAADLGAPDPNRSGPAFVPGRTSGYRELWNPGGNWAAQFEERNKGLGIALSEEQLSNTEAIMESGIFGEFGIGNLFRGIRGERNVNLSDAIAQSRRRRGARLGGRGGGGGEEAVFNNVLMPLMLDELGARRGLEAENIRSKTSVGLKMRQDILNMIYASASGGTVEDDDDGASFLDYAAAIASIAAAF